ncbi:YwqJ-related putative deaminase [Streptomyces desertarenae]|uniref:YwqJ-related putative deaminase n=1 Tax=Streptomyces desertarenae TaxID=2666184 RepID=A0ABW4PJ52_9ACTN
MSDGVPGAASLLIRGTAVSRTNLTGEGSPELHPAVRRFYDSLPPERREPVIGYCAGSALVSDRLWRLDQERGDGRTTTLDEARPHSEGSAIMSRKIREHGAPEHGQPTPACRSCTALLEGLSVQVLSA